MLNNGGKLSKQMGEMAANALNKCHHSVFLLICRCLVCFPARLRVFFSQVASTLLLHTLVWLHAMDSRKVSATTSQYSIVVKKCLRHIAGTMRYDPIQVYTPQQIQTSCLSLLPRWHVGSSARWLCVL